MKKHPPVQRSSIAADYIRTLQNDIAFMHSLVDQQRLDIEFYRGKVERLELALMSEAQVSAQHNYVERSEPPRSTLLNRTLPGVQPRMPFGELKRRWNAMSEKEQNEAMEKGWTVDAAKEEGNAGSQ